MITIITGTPGAGKTLYTVSEIKKEYESREIYYNNIPGLKLDWTYYEDPKEWAKLPSGAVLIVDEAHDHFPKRSNQSKEPSYIQALTTHRHQGLDIILITQFPKQLDVYIRRLAGRHIFLEKKLIRSQTVEVYVWAKYQEWYENPQVQESADNFQWTYPKESFGEYKSAEVHTTHKTPNKKLKRAVTMLVVAVGAMIYLGMGIMDRDGDGDIGEPLVSETIGGFRERRLIDNWYAERQTRVDGLPFSSPVYDGITTPKTYPKMACASSASKCLCYTQQASKVTIPESMCREIVKHGYFDAALEQI